MRKSIYVFPLVLLFAGMFMVSCLSSDDDDDIDEEWKLFNEQAFNKYGDNSDYTKLNALSNEGYIYWKRTSVITDSDKKEGRSDSDFGLRISKDGYPEFTDSIVCRYIGWYFTKGGDKIIFDSTEGPKYGSTIDPNKVPARFLISGGLIEGFRSAAQFMKKGDEREIVIPANLGYGGATTSSIPAYTTLWFNIKILDIVQITN